MDAYTNLINPADIAYRMWLENKHLIPFTDLSVAKYDQYNWDAINSALNYSDNGLENFIVEIEGNAGKNEYIDLLRVLRVVKARLHMSHPHAMFMPHSASFDSFAKMFDYALKHGFSLHSKSNIHIFIGDGGLKGYDIEAIEKLFRNGANVYIWTPGYNWESLERFNDNCKFIINIYKDWELACDGFFELHKYGKVHPDHLNFGNFFAPSAVPEFLKLLSMFRNSNMRDVALINNTLEKDQVPMYEINEFLKNKCNEGYAFFSPKSGAINNYTEIHGIRYILPTETAQMFVSCAYAQGMSVFIQAVLLLPIFFKGASKGEWFKPIHTLAEEMLQAIIKISPTDAHNWHMAEEFIMKLKEFKGFTEMYPWATLR